MLLKIITSLFEQFVRPFTSDERPQFPGSRSQWIEKLEFIRPDIYAGIPVYRVMDRKGKVIDPSQDPQVITIKYVKVAS